MSMAQATDQVPAPRDPDPYGMYQSHQARVADLDQLIASLEERLMRARLERSMAAAACQQYENDSPQEAPVASRF